MKKIEPTMSITLVAHRGFPAHYPENTLLGFQAAVARGATLLETDVQLSRDLQPMLYHDPTLWRTSGQTGHTWNHDAETLRRTNASENKRFGDRFAEIMIPSLRDFVAWLDSLQAVHALIEIKPESIARFGLQPTIDATLSCLQPILDRCVVISKHYPCLQPVRQWRSESAPRIGWVLPAWSDDNHRLADDLSPEVILCNHRRLPDRSQIWAGTWTWMAYTIDDVATALTVIEKGIDVIETNDIGALIDDARLRGTTS